MIEVEYAKELLMSGEIWVDPGFAQDINSGCCLIQESNPKL